MTTDGLREPAPRTEAAEPIGNGPRAEGRPTTTVLVIPLWERLRGGGRG
ncbi:MULTISPECIES: hypothetical protein [Streptomyces]|uniref:Uncharacterized protein n=1 Tax=Streptomyces koelreuteriae TaxID=2838015 RepID=A0ABX8FRA0_9ACTN|nr:MULTISPECIES: hypothetical protein [Streptomyces]QWB23552.1 hypothetical protein KJK29_13585 [Streptomyces koelreuteriae]UUA06510.1 hypothetical protein NNW98_13645 [Streptomyces koelreuteriae]UUA14139.1 hypothetical protein NNW99_13645 [Streptomyces sp. CRCS-T-1]